jgi:Nucleotidyl transferase AbiEii toxin, Type IV TA system
MANSPDIWSNEVLDEIFKAMATSRELSERLIYKGARVLRLRLAEPLRASFDIDASLAAITANFSTDTVEQTKFRELIAGAIKRHFAAQDPVRFELRGHTLERRRKTSPHPRGWDVFGLNLAVYDYRATPGSDPPLLLIDIAAPEEMSENSVSRLDVGGYQVNAITLERIVGEKLRAFLSCLPTYRKKIREKKIPPRRVKDLYDLARILRRRPFDNLAFWPIAGHEFTLACRSRCIDCVGLPSFHDGWEETERQYRASETIPQDVPFEEAESSLCQIIEVFARRNMIPFEFELPPLIV